MQLDTWGIDAAARAAKIDRAAAVEAIRQYVTVSEQRRPSWLLPEATGSVRWEEAAKMDEDARREVTADLWRAGWRPVIVHA